MPRKTIPTQTRFSVLSRDRFTCRYCSRSAPEVELHVDHVKAIANGGGNEFDNLVTACADCNLGKSDSEIDAVPGVPLGRSSKRVHPMLGRGFLSFKDGKVKEQGLITAVIEDPDGTFVVLHFFEWMGGGSTYERLVPLSELVFDGKPRWSGRTYRIFENNEDRNEYYEWKGDKFEDPAE